MNNQNLKERFIIEENEKIFFLQKSVIRWVKKHGRKLPWRKKMPWQQALILEMLLQRTQANQVEKIFTRFFNQFPDFESICSAKESEITEIIKPLGLFNLRVRRLKHVACTLKQRKKLPSISKLKEIKGVGEYIANAVHCFQRKKRIPILDTNFRRVYSRFFGWELPEDFRRIQGFKEIATEILPYKNVDWFNYGILDLAALICKPTPDCEICPLKSKCNYYQIKNSNYKES